MMEEETQLHYISIDESIQINRWAIKNYSHEFGVIDKQKLDQCLEIPKQVFFGSEIHPSVEKKAAVYLYYLTVFHPFVDGNKRTAFLSMCVFLIKNGYSFKSEQDGIVNLVLSIASGNESLDTVSEWLSSRIFQIE